MPRARLTLAVAQLLIICFTQSSYGASDFSLGFNLSGAASTFTGTCTAGSNYTASSFCGGGTKLENFSQDSVAVNGVTYWRSVVGDPLAGFAMVYYTRRGGSLLSGGLDGGGMEKSRHPNDPRRTSRVLCDQPAFSSAGPCGNAVDPLGIYTLSGTGTNDPSRSVFRMVLDYGDGMSMEIYKPLLNTKPKITQSVVEGALRSEFVADMRDITYSDKSTPIDVINNQVIDDPDLPSQGAGDFDMMMAERSRVTAGQFTFSRGQGWGIDNGAGWEPNPLGLRGWAETNSAFDYGVYNYSDGNFDVYNVDWGAFFRYSDNAVVCLSLPRSDPSMKSCPGGP
ncbi:MAG: hypothetical protein ACE5EH_02560 [Gammaproteobacteria bacterium]